MSEYQPLPEWATGHRMARQEINTNPDPELEDELYAELVSTGEPADLVTSWTGETEGFPTLADGTRPTADLGHQPETVHRPVLPITAAVAVRYGGPHGAQLFIDKALTMSKYLALVEALDAAGLLPAGALEAAYAEGFTAVHLSEEG